MCFTDSQVALFRHALLRYSDSEGHRSSLVISHYRPLNFLQILSCDVRRCSSFLKQLYKLQYTNGGSVEFVSSTESLAVHYKSNPQSLMGHEGVQFFRPVACHHFHFLIIREAHCRVHHNGVIRRSVPSFGGRSIVRSIIIHSCVVCKQFEGRPVSAPPQLPLPKPLHLRTQLLTSPAHYIFEAE